ncbi:type II toxin-antitoxin system RelE/ParE family toxin [Limnoraphis robusta Tam1]|jgi:mRNA interferase RelE/StbE|uniref:Type II toxin-antitoxin system RelE/ParE family toxin n=1 Tax=Limnoraphis robusta CCNP1315 TaxID=3110306 RepID=A0ABU5TWS4_9CYAN|nr:type II toxin-antitoxin system RelE/ParE family toxin [Limnoraphis robusta]MEA5500296.1 type II toxin-antitoxin system RelE/ParE family toxin [Limnoraphis robusta BA-68 BA1]MEA5519367.1 type II toxin-antitoxin system RelE/ParE family toxin [Limnoraphis robusta CCNP1315]MEA5538616.1 type II toxin-antitoxin system RelE/ParE family toxin [Limnoraphis robusta Tam1]MEA5545115.1 type II toxin-antitoxin system RelE/ParE family toxin [Limnoraphis robusta CCNP1324]
MYQIQLSASAHNQGKKLPGVIRQRIKNIIDALAQDPRPYNSIQLDFETEDSWEPRRIRVDSWRIIYAIDDEFQQIVILAIRKRPPYDYSDLSDLLTDLG